MGKFEARGQFIRLPAEVRESEGDIQVAGYAAVFNQEADIGGYFRERIAPGAFTDAIGRDDVAFLFNHDEDTVMARTRSGTLTLSEDDHGLKIAARLEPGDPDAQRVLHKMRRGDIDKMSFAFFPEVEEWDTSGDVAVRTLKTVRLHDVSAVTWPAYDGTEIALRSLAAHRDQQRRSGNFAATQRRLRMKTDYLGRIGRENG